MPRSSIGTTRDRLPHGLAILLAVGLFILAPDLVHEGLATIIAMPLLILIAGWGIVFYFLVLVEILRGIIGIIIRFSLFIVELARPVVYSIGWRKHNGKAGYS